jgi:hypothetical protein
MMCSRLVSTPDRNLVHLSDGLPDDGEGVMADLSVRHQVVWADHSSVRTFGLFTVANIATANIRFLIVLSRSAHV